MKKTYVVSQKKKKNCVKNKSNNLLNAIKSTNFNKKSHFKTFVYVLYDTNDFMIRYVHMIHTLYRTIYKHLRIAYLQYR